MEQDPFDVCLSFEMLQLWETQITTSRKLKGPTAQGLICKQTALRTEHDSIAKNWRNRKQAHSGEGLAAIYKDVLKKYCKKSISN